MDQGKRGIIREIVSQRTSVEIIREESCEKKIRNVPVRLSKYLEKEDKEKINI